MSYVHRKRIKGGGKGKNNEPLIFANAGHFRDMLGVLNSIELKPQKEEEDNDEVQIPPQAYEQLSLFSEVYRFKTFFL